MQADQKLNFATKIFHVDHIWSFIFFIFFFFFFFFFFGVLKFDVFRPTNLMN